MSTINYVEKPHLTSQPVEELNDDKIVDAENGGKVQVHEVRVAEEA